MKRVIQARRRSGFTLAETMIVVGCIGLLAAIAIPTFSKARAASRQKAMESNVRLLNQAVQMWAMDTLTPDSEPIGVEVLNYIKGGLDRLSVGSSIPEISNIVSRTVGYTFQVSDIY